MQIALQVALSCASTRFLHLSPRPDEVARAQVQKLFFFFLPSMQLFLSIFFASSYFLFFLFFDGLKIEVLYFKWLYIKFQILIFNTFRLKTDSSGVSVIKCHPTASKKNSWQFNQCHIKSNLIHPFSVSGHGPAGLPAVTG